MPRLPNKCFLSHSYKDVVAVQLAQRVLGHRTTLVIFPRRRIDAANMISDHLFDRIADSTGLIYLKGGESESSFWVLLETDLAKRAGLPVFAFDARTRKLEQDDSKPLNIRVLPVYNKRDEWVVFRILRYLERERFLGELFDDRAIERVGHRFGDWEQEQHAGKRCVLLFVRAQSVAPALPAKLSSRLIIGALDRGARCPEDVSDWQFVQLCRDDEKYVTAGKPVLDMFQPSRHHILDDPRSLPGPEWGESDDSVRESRRMRGVRERYKGAGQRSPWSLPDGLDLRRVDDLVIRIFRACVDL